MRVDAICHIPGIRLPPDTKLELAGDSVLHSLPFEWCLS